MKIASWALALVAVAGIAAAQQPPMTVMVSGLGCSTASGSNTFPITEWTFSASAPPTITHPSPAHFSDFSIAMNSDACSAKLALNHHVSLLTMTEYDATGKQVMTVQLTNAIVAANGTNGAVLEIRFTYDTIRIATYYPNLHQAGWNLVANIPY